MTNPVARLMAARSVAARSVAARSVAARSVAARSVAARLVAARQVAARQVAGRQVAGRSAAAWWRAQVHESLIPQVQAELSTGPRHARGALGARRLCPALHLPQLQTNCQRHWMNLWEK
jgi:hypothetical protein